MRPQIIGETAVPAFCFDGGGITIVGRHFDDATVLRAGHAYQRLGSRSGAVGQHA